VGEKFSEIAAREPFHVGDVWVEGLSVFSACFADLVFCYTRREDVRGEICSVGIGPEGLVVRVCHDGVEEEEAGYGAGVVLGEEAGEGAADAVADKD
jgi:hypothetical protein